MALPTARALPLLVAAALSAAALAGCLERGPLAPPTLEPLEVRAQGAWLRDRRGRAVLLRGVTIVGLEARILAGAPAGPAAPFFDRLEEQGWNAIRFSISRDRLEARPGVLDGAFLAGVLGPAIRHAAHRGMAVVLALREPAWEPCSAAGDETGGERCARSPAAIRVRRAGCSFLRGGKGSPRADLLRAWAELGRRYGTDTRIAAFEILNEPPADLCPAEKAWQALASLHRAAARALAAVGSTRPVLLGPPASPLRRDALRARNALPSLPKRPPGVAWLLGIHVFPHRYGPPAGVATPTLAAALIASTAQRARALGAAPFFAEIGSDRSPDETGRRGTSRALLAPAFDALDASLASGAVFSLRLGTDPGARAALTRLGASAAVRPWARRIAGTPTAMRFDRERRVFSLSFRDASDGASDPTEVFVPSELYPGGFRVEVLPGGRARLDPIARRVLVYRGRAATGHLVRIAPAPSRASTPAEAAPPDAGDEPTTADVRARRGGGRRR